MGQRGRKSVASLSVVGEDALETVRRPSAPDGLTDEQVAVWDRVVSSLPADWFRPETLDMLAQYCRHVVTADRVAQLIQAEEASDEFDVDQYDKLLKLQEREGRAMSSLATRMRITQQATFDKERKKGKSPQSKRPWQ